MRLVFSLFISFVLFSCSEAEKTKTPPVTPIERTVAPEKNMEEVAPKSPSIVSRYTVATFLQPEGWGYYISEKGKQIIKQETIPGVPGNQGFQTSEEALKVAELVRSKMEKGTFPPTISEEELQKLGIYWRN
jgi:hypothetical protein